MSSNDLQFSDRESATINHLPNETLLSIFQHLNIKDVIRSRLVCKRFLPLCDEVRVTEVIISANKGNMTGHWFHTNRTFNYADDAIDLGTFMAYKNRSKFQLEKVIKRLFFAGDYSDYKQLNLNSFTQLEELHINLGIPNIIHVGNEDILSLPNLKLLDFVNFGLFTACGFYFHTLTLVLEAPKLKTLKCLDSSEIHLVHPDTIEHLEVRRYSGMLGTTARLLTNLRYLRCEKGVPYNLDILSIFPKLETLVFNTFLASLYELPESHKGEICNLRRFVEQKRILKRPELRIFFQSVEVDAKKLDEYESAKSVFSFQMNNYDTLCDNIPYDEFSPIDYNELMESVQGNVPDDFFKKFWAIPAVKVSGPVNQEHLLQFLKRMENFRRLELNDAILDQRFFDGLYQFGELTDLHMRETSTFSYDFLVKMKQLQTFTIERQSAEIFDLSLPLFRELKYFRRIELVRYEEYIEISRNTNEYEFQRWELRHGGQLDYKETEIDFEQLTRLVNEHKNGTLVANRKAYSRYCEDDA